MVEHLHAEREVVFRERPGCSRSGNWIAKSQLFLLSSNAQ